MMCAGDVVVLTVRHVVSIQRQKCMAVKYHDCVGCPTGLVTLITGSHA